MDVVIFINKKYRLKNLIVAQFLEHFNAYLNHNVYCNFQQLFKFHLRS